MNCPKCARPIVDTAALECSACGVLLRKAVSEHLRASGSEPPHPVVKQSTLLPIVFAVFVIALAVIFVMSRRQNAANLSADGWYAGAEGYERAKAEQTDGKPILLVFHTDWCGWCKRLDADVFSSPEFRSRYGSMAKVKVDAEGDRASQQLAREFGVRGFPSAYVIKRGEAPKAIVGYMPPGPYMAEIAALSR